MANIYTCRVIQCILLWRHTFESYFQTQKPFQNKRMLDDYRSSEEFASYEALCRGEETHVSTCNLGILCGRLCKNVLVLKTRWWSSKMTVNWKLKTWNYSLLSRMQYVKFFDGAFNVTTTCRSLQTLTNWRVSTNVTIPSTFTVPWRKKLCFLIHG